MKFYLEIHEDGQRIPAGHPKGYDTLEEAGSRAKSMVDDALPQNTVHILQDVGHAYLAGDGGNELKLHRDAPPHFDVRQMTNQEIEQAITTRSKLLENMVGTLYPNLVKVELTSLRSELSRRGGTKCAL